MKLGVLILNWNGLRDTRECLHSLLPAPSGVTVYVIDNGSSDDSAREIATEFGDSVRIIETGVNLLFAGGNNVGIQVALEDGCDAVLLLNNDTTVDARTLPNLIAAGTRTPDTLLCPKILYFHKPDVLWYAGGIWSRGRIAHRGIRQRDLGQFDIEEVTAWGTGCALWIPKSVIQRIGVLDDEFKLYFEDVEYCLRAGRNGVNTTYIPDAKVWHKVSSSLGGHGTLKKQRRKFRSLGLMLEKIDASSTTMFAAYTNFFVVDPLRAFIAKLTH